MKKSSEVRIRAAVIIGITAFLIIKGIMYISNHKKIYGEIRRGKYMDYTIDNWREFDYSEFIIELSDRVDSREEEMYIGGWNMSKSASVLRGGGAFFDCEFMKIEDKEYGRVYFLVPRSERVGDLYELNYLEGKFFLENLAEKKRYRRFSKEMYSFYHVKRLMEKVMGEEIKGEIPEIQGKEYVHVNIGGNSCYYDEVDKLVNVDEGEVMEVNPPYGTYYSGVKIQTRTGNKKECVMFTEEKLKYFQKK